MTSSDFEKKVENAKEVLSKLMNPDITLQDSVALYKNGINELKEAEKILEQAAKDVEEMQKGENE